MFNWNYEVIGFIGFAQVGTGEYFTKEKIEKQVILDIVKKNEMFKVPLELTGVANLRYKSFTHDFGTYYELCVVFDEDEIEDDETLNEAFWEWINKIQGYDFESEEIMAQCQALYVEQSNLTVIQGGKSDNRDSNLKIS